MLGPIMRPPPRAFSANAEPGPFLSHLPSQRERSRLAVELPDPGGDGTCFVVPREVLLMNALAATFGLTPDQADAARSRARTLDALLVE